MEKLANRITAQQKDDLHNRRIRTKDLAVILGVTANHLSKMYPDKVPGLGLQNLRDKRRLRQVRNEFRETLAWRVTRGEITVLRASEIAHCSCRNMYRYLAKLCPSKTTT